MVSGNVVLTDYQVLLVEQLDNSARYQDVSRVSGESLPLVKQSEAEDASSLEVLHSALTAGTADMEQG